MPTRQASHEAQQCPFVLVDDRGRPVALRLGDDTTVPRPLLAKPSEQRSLVTQRATARSAPRFSDPIVVTDANGRARQRRGPPADRRPGREVHGLAVSRNDQVGRIATREPHRNTRTASPHANRFADTPIDPRTIPSLASWVPGNPAWRHHHAGAFIARPTRHRGRARRQRPAGKALGQITTRRPQQPRVPRWSERPDQGRDRARRAR